MSALHPPYVHRLPYALPGRKPPQTHHSGQVLKAQLIDVAEDSGLSADGIRPKAPPPGANAAKYTYSGCAPPSLPFFLA